MDQYGQVTLSSSDASLKTNVTDLLYGLLVILQMRSVGFNWILDASTNGSQNEIEFIAQEMQQIIPEVIDDCKTDSRRYVVSRLCQIIDVCVGKKHPRFNKVISLLRIGSTRHSNRVSALTAITISE